MRRLLKNPYCVMISITAVLFFTAFYHSSSLQEIYDGLLQILQTPDILVTDYIELGGLSAAFFNSAVMGVLCIILLILTKHEANEKTIMTLWLVCGFSFFGKNISNTMPIIAGGYLYTRYVREPFRDNIIYTFLATGLAPAVSQLYFTGFGSWWIGIIAGVSLGLMIGFLIIPVTKNTAILQGGFNLYNSGFSAGILAMLIMALFRGRGIDFSAVSVWSSGNNEKIIVVLVVLSLFLVFAGVMASEDFLVRLEESFVSIFSGQNHDNHSYNSVKGYSYINMGILGLFSSFFMLFLKVELSGPVIGGIFTIIGFGCCGKSLKNIVPIMVGATIAGAMSSYGLSTPNVAIAILFSTCLAPFAKKYGPWWGILAGILHINFVMYSSNMHGGMNLYNNGLGGGFVAILLFPFIETIQKRTKKRIME